MLFFIFRLFFVKLYLLDEVTKAMSFHYFYSLFSFVVCLYAEDEEKVYSSFLPAPTPQI